MFEPCGNRRPGLSAAPGAGIRAVPHRAWVAHRPRMPGKGLNRRSYFTSDAILASPGISASVDTRFRRQRHASTLQNASHCLRFASRRLKLAARPRDSGSEPAMHLKPFNRRGFSFRSGPAVQVLPQATLLDLTLRAQYIAPPAAGPFSDLRRGFFIPGQSSPRCGSPSR
jgi:hypothetical protein